MPVNTNSTLQGLNNYGTGWPGTMSGSNSTNNYTPRLAQDEKVGAIYGASGEWATHQANIFAAYLTPWCNSFTSSRPNGYERHGFLAGEVRNVTLNGKPTTTGMDRNHPTCL